MKGRVTRKLNKYKIQREIRNQIRIICGKCCLLNYHTLNNLLYISEKVSCQIILEQKNINRSSQSINGFKLKQQNINICQIYYLIKENEKSKNC